MSTVTPVILWAQRSDANNAEKNVLYLTIQVVDPINICWDITATSLKFSADSPHKDIHYELNINFFEEIDSEKSQKNLRSGSNISLILRKNKAKDEYWPRLTKEDLKYYYIKTDFDKWVDEDEQDERAEENDDLSSMMNLGGAGGGGPGGLDFSQLMQGAGGGSENFDIGSLANQLGEKGENAESTNDEDDDIDDVDVYAAKESAKVSEE